MTGGYWAKRPITDDERRIADEMRDAGESWDSVAARLGVSRSWLIARAGRGDAPVATKEWPAERRAALLAIFAEGLSYGAMAKRLGTTKNAVCGVLIRMGVAGARGSPILPPKPAAAPVSDERAARAEAGKYPLPPFHPIAKSAIDAAMHWQGY